MSFAFQAVAGRYRLVLVLAILITAFVVPLVATAGPSATPAGSYVAARPNQVECRFLCDDGHDGVLACPPGVGISLCEEFLTGVCDNHGGFLAIHCYQVP